MDTIKPCDDTVMDDCGNDDVDQPIVSGIYNYISIDRGTRVPTRWLKLACMQLIHALIILHIQLYECYAADSPSEHQRL